MSAFWSLPGPSRFVEHVAVEARAGNSVLVAIPEFHPEFLSSAVRTALANDFGWKYISIDPTLTPIELLFGCCLPDFDPGSLRTIKNLITQPEFCGNAIWVQGLTANPLSSWLHFLLEYAHMTRSLSFAQQTVLLIPMIGQLVSTSLPQEPGLSIVSWNGSMDRLDIDLHAAVIAGDRLAGLEKQLTVAISAELGGADPELINFLIGLELKQLLSPINLLREFATARGWDNSPQSREWWTGKTYELEGETFVNAAVCALEGGSAEIEQAIWRAEARTLFPVIEYYRQQFVRKYYRLLRPYKNEYQAYEIPDLEIYMIKRQLADYAGVERRDLALVHDLHGARNSLAHLRAVDPNIVLRLCSSTRPKSRG